MRVASGQRADNDCACGSVRFGALFGCRLLPRWLRFGSVRCAVRLSVTSSVVAVRFGSVRCSAGGYFLGGCGSAGVGSLGWLGSVGVGSLGWLGSGCGWRTRPLPPSVAPSVAGAVPERPESEQPSTPEHCPSAPSERLSAVTADASTERRATADGGRMGDARKRARKGG